MADAPCIGAAQVAAMTPVLVAGQRTAARSVTRKRRAKKRAAPAK